VLKGTLLAVPSSESSQRRVIVIGSGPAGAAAATFLSQAGVETLVMEAGAEDAPLGFTARLRGFTIAKRRPVLRQRPDFTALGDPRTELFEELAPGGLSNHWACAVPRFSREDFLDAKRAGEEQTWPIDYADLEPWYERVEPLLKIAAGVQDSARLPCGRVARRWELAAEWGPVANAARSVGRDVVVMPYANGASTLFTHSATAFNAFSQLILPAARARSAGGAVQRPGAAPQLVGARAPRGRVVYRDRKTGREQELPCRAVVVAGGAVNSAQILLQSQSADFPHGLGNEHDVLGRYLHDHPLGKLVFELPRAVPIHPASYITRPSLEASPPLLARPACSGAAHLPSHAAR
jgi:choline dehydrogenase-like flavoprotein